ncbi:MAG: hypothetical protein JSV16_06105 [Candidatus Hydrogenedentota bacterium]|nr:MAG: hypothetical protein JSV16_06105 [Candidatus Hydrogenedentota bacterium]
MEKHLSSPTEGTLERICADLGTARPRGNIVLAHGKPAWSVTYLALYMAFAGIARDKPVIFLDGANSFDPFLISKTARRAGLIPEELLGRIHISRAFTCHQMEALVVERLADALRKFDTDVAIVSGLLDTFYDQDVPSGEAYDLLRTTTAEFVRLSRQGARILIACPDTHLPLESRQKRFVNLLRKISDKVLQSEGSDGQTRFALEKPHRKHYGPLEIPEFSRHQRWR